LINQFLSVFGEGLLGAEVEMTINSKVPSMALDPGWVGTEVQKNLKQRVASECNWKPLHLVPGLVNARVWRGVICDIHYNFLYICDLVLLLTLNAFNSLPIESILKFYLHWMHSILCQLNQLIWIKFKSILNLIPYFLFSKMWLYSQSSLCVFPVTLG
jgi:hypothetical protein